VPDRRGHSIDLLAVIGRDLSGQMAAQLLECTPQPADTPTGSAQAACPARLAVTRLLPKTLPSTPKLTE
jgi:hypothetical protein